MFVLNDLLCLLNALGYIMIFLFASVHTYSNGITADGHIEVDGWMDGFYFTFTRGSIGKESSTVQQRVDAWIDHRV